jgi:hypothetical protein
VDLATTSICRPFNEHTSSFRWHSKPGKGLPSLKPLARYFCASCSIVCLCAMLYDYVDRVLYHSGGSGGATAVT